MHVHAYNHLLTLTTATVTDRAPHQLWAHGSPDAHKPAHHVTQVYRSMQGSLPRRCRALLRRPLRWPAGLQQPLHLAARARHRRQRRWRVLQCGVCPWSALGGVRGPRGGRVAASHAWSAHADLGCARSGARKAPSGSEAGPGVLGPACCGAPRSLWGGPRRHRPKVGPVMGACTCASVPGLVPPVVVITVS